MRVEILTTTKIKKGLKRVLSLIFVSFLFFELLGCDAFVRKFTRKPKKKDLPPEEMVLVPEEYKTAQPTYEELYRQYFLFWKSWHNELISSLTAGANHKKQIDCIKESIENLRRLRTLLGEDIQKKMDIYINRLVDLENSIRKDPYGNNTAQNRLNAERIRSNILRFFSYKKISAVK